MKQANLERIEKLRELMRRQMRVGLRNTEISVPDLAFLIACADRLAALETELAAEQDAHEN